MDIKNNNLQRMYYMKKELGLLKHTDWKLAIAAISDLRVLKVKNEASFLIPLGSTSILINISLFSTRLSKIGANSQGMMILEDLIKNGIQLYVGASAQKEASNVEHWLDLAYCPAGSLELEEQEKKIDIPEPFFILDTKISQSLWAFIGTNEGTDFSNFRPAKCDRHLYPTVDMNFKDAHYFVQKLNDRLGLESFVEIADFNFVWEDGQNEDDEDDEDDEYGYKEDDMRIGTDLSVSSANILADGFRIPTLDEWEYAAIAGEPELLYPGSNKWDEICAPKKSEDSIALKLKTKKPNAWLVYDTCHKVFEFTNNLLEYHLGQGGDLLANAKTFFNPDNSDDACIAITKYNKLKDENFMHISRSSTNVRYSVCDHDQLIGFRIMLPAKTILKELVQNDA